MARGYARLPDRRVRSWRPPRQYRRAAASGGHAGYARRPLDGRGEMKLLSFGMICVLLGGCTSQEVSIRSEPAENPAAQNAAAAASAAAFAAAAQTSAASAAAPTE